MAEHGQGDGILETTASQSPVAEQGSGGVFRRYDEVGKDGYPPEWHTTIKHAVRDQAGHRCVRCHHPYFVKTTGNVTETAGHERVRPSTGQYVHVSRCDDECRHGGPVIYWTSRTGWGDYDGPDETIAEYVYGIWRVLTVHHLNMDKADCRWWNLAALCQRCHLSIQGKVRMAQVYAGEHSDWFKPYAAGYYASVDLGQELPRAETMARLDELLALELAPTTTDALKRPSPKEGARG